MMFALTAYNKCFTGALCAGKNHQLFTKAFAVLNDDKHVSDHWI
jgi:hypothetical protein